MNLNVWTWVYRPKYYLAHPWKWFGELFTNIRAAYRRARYGWDYSDAWSYDEYFLAVTPQIFRHIADYGMAYPGPGTTFDTPEKWHDWLHSVADVLESLQEENWYSQNPYEEEFHRLSDVTRKTWTDEKGFIHYTHEKDLEFEEVRARYLKEYESLNKKRQELIEDTLKQIGENFFMLWD